MRYPLLCWSFLALSAVTSACFPSHVMTPPVDAPPVQTGSQADPGIARLFVEAGEVARWVCTDCKRVQLVPDSRVKTWAAASWDGFGNGVILYHPGSFTNVENTHGPAAVLGIIAHEWGHIATKSASQVTADTFAGCVLRVLQVDPQPFVDWLGSVHLHEPEDFAIRSHAVGAGWSRCVDPAAVVDAFDGGSW